MKTLKIVITSDFICPWCWIGHAHLLAALKTAAPSQPMQIRFAPFELNPEMPRKGLNRKDYRSAKFGSWARSQAMDAEVARAGGRAGLAFDYDRVQRIPNTRMAHRLMSFAQEQGDFDRSGQLFASIFHAYFSAGLDIGQADVLAGLASQAGFDVGAVRLFLHSGLLEAKVEAAELQARGAGIRSVPTLRLGDIVLTGALPPEVLAATVREAIENDAATTLA